jgi:hypothetical protein
VDNQKAITHGLGKYPDFVVVQLKLSNGYVSEAGGKNGNKAVSIANGITGVFLF